MQPLRIATAQFEHRSGDKAYNLSNPAIDRQSRRPGRAGRGFSRMFGATGYAFARHLSREQLLDLAEAVPEGESIRALTDIAREYQVAVLAGLFEKDAEGRVFKAYVCVDSTGLVAKYHKLHPFINPHLTPGNGYVTFDLHGWTCRRPALYADILSPPPESEQKVVLHADAPAQA